MGRYIDDILQPGEKVLYSTNAHWIFYLPAIAAWVVALGPVLPVALDHDRGARAVVPGRLRPWSRSPHCTGPSTAWFHRWTTETDVTNLRVVHKTGFIKRRTFEMSARQGRERRRQPEHSRPHPQLRRRDHHAASARAGKPSRPSPRRWRSAIPSPRDRTARTIHDHATKFFRQPSSASGIDRRSRRGREILETVGRVVGPATARWRRCTRSIRCG